MLVATPGSPVANSYVTVVDATAFLEERLYTEAWFASGQEDLLTLQARREASLIWATRLLDEQMRWRGTPTTTTQALAWPQTGQIDAYGRPIATNIIPDDIQRATADYALALLGETSETPGQASPTAIKRKRLGQTEIEYFAPTTTTPVSVQTQMPPEVRQMLKPYGYATGGVVIALIRA